VPVKAFLTPAAPFVVPPVQMPLIVTNPVDSFKTPIELAPAPAVTLPVMFTNPFVLRWLTPPLTELAVTFPVMFKVPAPSKRIPNGVEVEPPVTDPVMFKMPVVK